MGDRGRKREGDREGEIRPKREREIEKARGGEGGCERKK